jgi:hypothetical protein
MDAEEFATMIASVQSCFGAEAKIYIYPDHVPTTLNLLQRELISAYGEAYSLFVVERGPAEIFCLSGFDHSPVVMSDRYIDLFYRLRVGLSPPFSPSAGQVLGIQSLLSAVAELALTHGDEDFAVAMFLQSLQHMKLFLGPGPTFSEIGNNPMNEMGVVQMFFGLLHEIGHAYLALYARNRLVYTSEQEKTYNELVATLINRDFNSTDEAKDRYRQLSQQEGSALAPKTLAEEIWADAFAARVLYAVAPRLMVSTGITDFDHLGLATEIIVAIRIASTIEFARVVAQLSRDGEFTAQAVMDKWNVLSMTFSIRQQCILETLIEDLAASLDPELSPQPELQIRAKMTELMEVLIEKFIIIDRSISMVATLASLMSKSGAHKPILDDLISKLSEPGETMRHDKIRAFLEVAETTGASGEALSALRNLIASLSSASGECTDQWSMERIARYFSATKLPRTRPIDKIARLLKF